MDVARADCPLKRQKGVQYCEPAEYNIHGSVSVLVDLILTAGSRQTDFPQHTFFKVVLCMCVCPHLLHIELLFW